MIGLRLTVSAVLGAVATMATGASLDLEKAYLAARVNDPATLAAQAGAQAAREVLPQARAQLLPNIGATVVRNRNQLQAETPDFRGVINANSYSYPSSNDTLTVRQPIFRKGLWAQLNQAQAQVQESEALLENEYQNLAVKVAGAYFEALLAKEQVQLVRSQIESRRALLDAASKMFAAGSGTRTEIDEMQARLDLALAQELEAEQAVASTRQQLANLVGEPFEELAPLQEEAPNLEEIQPNKVEDWIMRAEASSAELRVMNARLEAARQEVKKVSSGHLPTLDAVVQWSRSSSENSNSLDSRYETRSAGLQLTIPLFAGGGVSAAVRQAMANEERARYSLEAVRRDVGSRVHKEFRGVTEGLLRIKALSAAVNSAKQAEVSATKSSIAGLRTRLDVLNAKDARLMAARDLTQARFVYLISRLRLAALVGEADAEAVAKINLAFLAK